MAQLPWVPAPGGKDQEDPKGLPPIPVSTVLTSLGLWPLPVLSEPSPWNFLVSLPLTPCLALWRTAWRHYAVDDVMAPAQWNLPVMGRGVPSQASDFTWRCLQSSLFQHILETGIQSWHWMMAGTDTPQLQGAH